MTIMGVLFALGAAWWVAITAGVVFGYQPDRLTVFFACAVTTIIALNAAASYW